MKQFVFDKTKYRKHNIFFLRIHISYYIQWKINNRKYYYTNTQTLYSRYIDIDLYVKTNNTWRAYLQPNAIFFKHTTNGILEVVADTRTTRTEYDPFNEAENKAVDTILAASEPSSGFSVLVRLR